MDIAASKRTSPAVFNCSIAKLKPHPHNLRGPIESDSVQELLTSVKRDHVIVPLMVVKEGSDYVIVAGHRRHKTAQLAKLKTVPIIVKQLTPIEQEEMMLLENIQRENLSPLQEAMAYDRLIKQGVTQRDIVRKLSLTPHRVSSRLEILKLAPPVQKLFATGNELPVTSIQHLIKVSSPVRQHQLAALVSDRQLTVLELGQIIE